jgi:formate dehydrogenase maturation protein FdhE
LNIEGEEGISAYTCETCRRYLKTIKIPENRGPFLHEEIIMDYLCSGDMDIAAMQNKFVQESVLGTRFTGPDDPHLDFYVQKLTQ